MKSAAVFSPCRKYRYSLTRVWNSNGKRVLFILLNPSTADESNDDPTVRRCISFAMDWGYGSMEVVNLFALRASSPIVLYTARFPVGRRNVSMILKACKRVNAIILGWGNHGTLFGFGCSVIGNLIYRGFELYCFGKTKKGQPKHPLYLPKTSRVMLWKEAG